MCGYILHLGGCFFFFNDTATTEIYTLSLHDALPILFADQNVNYEGESGADFTIAVDTKNIVPTTIDSTIKAMVVNKYNANLNRLIIRTHVDVDVLDYVIDDGDVYVILSKKLISGDSDTPLYECRAVKETNASLSFSGADIDNPLHRKIDGFNMTQAGIITGALITESGYRQSGLITVNLPVTFPNTFKSIIIEVGEIDGSNAYWITFYQTFARILNTSQFEYRILNTINTWGSAYKINYIAVGD